ncbi:MAG: hypothetical protein Q9207_007606 [Kuettlingeria erythrocarpa]
MPDQVADSPSIRTGAFKTVVVFLCALLTLMFWMNDWKSPTSSGNHHPTESAEEDDTCPPVHPQLRTAFGSKSTTIRAWPSQGGFYSLHPAGVVELDFLGLDRFTEAPRSDDPTEEDALCQRMRAMGAEWFRHEDDIDKWTPPVIRDGRRVGKQQLWFGWPENGGVWVLELEEFEADRKGVGRIYNACNMEERCRVLERLGATFFGKAADCRHTKDIDFPGRKELEPNR